MNAAADVICRAQKNGTVTPAGIAMALESAQLLQAPDTAQRLAELEARIAEYERPVDEDPIAYALIERASATAGFCRNKSPYGRRCDQLAGHDGDHGMADGAGGHFGWPASDEDVTPQVRKLRALLSGQRNAVEDPHDSPLHHDYRVGRDLPETGGA
ncbi:hypothetical protein U9R90_25130 [Streptomyces sp. E11-3]|uniref:hypothetical protein n=1 Tax=Streptomyces sp. E11-3 TaxID=3110112 RepID=UPI00397EB82F